MCGEHPYSRPRRSSRSGPSPRVRGTHGVDLAARARLGIIPARAGNTPCPRLPARRAGDHPRVCGEHSFSFASSNAARGSSPRVRGTPVRPHRLAREGGIIPARAGNTAPRTRRATCPWDHPRVCGEHSSFHLSCWILWGSSPRVRGTRVLVPSEYILRGIIPACAGNTRPGPETRACLSDHPRVCGEHADKVDQQVIDMGSSPRVRGTRERRGPFHHDHGIIPACAGNTRRGSRRSHPRRDHPRVCGEHSDEPFTAEEIAGSSPRVRGTLADNVHRIHDRGIIPACAGNTPMEFEPISPERDHPRVCGEHNRKVLTMCSEEGSSPRVRGTRVLGRDDEAELGIIPACAGNTSQHRPALPSFWDHPRVCGEHTSLQVMNILGKGSSPRVRGTPLYADLSALSVGIIPACAGNTRRGPCGGTRSRDHPRVCGEHWGFRFSPFSIRGSSPRVRGTPDLYNPDLLEKGIIPACAGNTITGKLYKAIAGDHPRVCGEHRGWGL